MSSITYIHDRIIRGRAKLYVQVRPSAEVPSKSVEECKPKS
jgi:hypothetical protein